MNIALLITELNSGGAEWQLARLANNLQQLNHQVRVYALYGNGEAARWLKEKSIPVSVIGFDHPFNFWKLLELFNLLRRQQPDVLHTWMFHANIIGKVSGRAAGIQNIVASLRVAEKKRKYHTTIERKTAFLNSALTVNSPGLLQFASDRGFPEHKLQLIPNSIDLTPFPFSPPTPPADGKPWRILYLGRISPQKGLEHLIGALKQIDAAYNFKVDIVGSAAHQPALEALRRQIKENDLVETVGLKPPVSHRQVPELLTKYHLLVLPSLWEGMPNVVMEAFAAGLPVVATNIEGSNDLIRPGKTGHLAEPADAQDLAQSIEKCLNNYDRTLEMGRNARLKLEKHHSPASITKRYLEVYTGGVKAGTEF